MSKTKAPIEDEKRHRHPTEALKRFAKELENSSEGTRFLQINQNRVQQFVEKPSVELYEFQSSRTIEASKSVPLKLGAYDYSELGDCRSNSLRLLEVQAAPECQREMGYRTRFGDGDGSFFDTWLNSGSRYSKVKFDEHGLPRKKQQNVEQAPINGFKRLYMLQSVPSASSESIDTKGHRNYSTIQSYEDRRRARLQREEEERKKEAEKLLLTSLDQQQQHQPNQTPSDFIQISSSKPFEGVDRDFPAKGSNKLTPLPPMTEQETDTYFGDNARLSFFDYYKQLSRQRQVFSIPSPTKDVFSSGVNAAEVNQLQSSKKEASEQRRQSSVTSAKRQAGSQGIDVDDEEAASPGDGRRRASASEVADRRRQREARTRATQPILRGMDNAQLSCIYPPDIANDRVSNIHDKLNDKFSEYLITNSSEHEFEPLHGTLFPGSPLMNADHSTPGKRGPLMLRRRSSQHFRKMSMSAVALGGPTKPSSPPNPFESIESEIMCFPAPFSPDGGESRKISPLASRASSRQAQREQSTPPPVSFEELLSEAEQHTVAFHIAPPKKTISLSRPDSVKEDESGKASTATGAASTSARNKRIAVMGVKRPISARTRFLISCINNGIQPDPSLIVRRNVSSTLNISSMLIGDTTAQILAESLPVLPMLDELKIADNRLTDIGLEAILSALKACPRITSLDISQNKVDSLAARSLGEFLASSECNISNLIMKNADVDDLEAARFVKAIGVRNSLKYLDLSKNLLGSHELRPEKRGGNIITGAEELGSLLAQPTCPLTTLILSWNMIRLTSCVALTRSIQANRSLTHLDLSFNGLGPEGGEILGNALHSHPALRYLNVAHNKIMPRAAFTILSGMRSCETLRKLDLSENPIGEVGAKTVVSLQVLLGDEIEIDIRGCTIRTKDQSCWFSPQSAAGDYKLNLAIPYERAVCIELLRLTAANADINVTRFTYIGAEKGSGSQELQFDVGTVAKIQKLNASAPNSSQSGEAGSGDSISADLDKARRLFRQFDEDGNGSLDRQELAKLLKLLGLTNSKAAIDQMLAVYDVDGAGVIEEAEFVEFLSGMQKTAQQAKEMSSQKRFMILKGSSSATPYIPPDAGTVDCQISYGSSSAVFLQTATSGNVQSVLAATKALSDSSAMIECALESMNLRYDEAMILYRIMIKETGNKFKVLQQLLPRLASCADARRFLNKVSGCIDVEDRIRMKGTLGRVYDTFVQPPNGFYCIQLSDEMEHRCFSRLVDICSKQYSDRSKADLGDTGQYGNGIPGFRNVILDGEPFTPSKQWLANIPTHGKLEFDFVNLNAALGSEQPMSDSRLLNLLVGLGLLQESQRSHVYARLSLLMSSGRTAAMGVGIMPFEINSDEAEEAAAQLDKLHDNIVLRGHSMERHYRELARERDACAKQMVRLQLLAEEASAGTGSGSTSPTKASKKSGPSSSMKMQIQKPPIASFDRLESGGSQNSGSMGGSIVTLHSTVAPDGSLTVEAYASHLHKLRNAEVSFELFSHETFEALIDLLGGRCITCAQLVIVLEVFPSHVKDDDSSVSSSVASPPLAIKSEFGRSESAGSAASTDARLPVLDVIAALADDANSELSSTVSTARGEDVSVKGTLFPSESSRVQTPSAQVKPAPPSTKYHSLKLKSNKYVKEPKEVKPQTVIFTTFHVDLVVTLFPFIVDVINFELVIHVLTPAERGIVLFRLGILNLWNPLKPEGCLSLNLARRDERLVLKTYIMLSSIEPGENWVGETYRLTRNEPPVADWELPLGWFIDTALPTHGIVNFRYYSGGGTGKNDCSPNVPARMTLMSLVFAQSYQQDSVKFHRPTVTASNHLNTEFGTQLILQ